LSCAIAGTIATKNGAEWALPGKPQLDDAGTQRKDRAGKKLYVAVVKIPDDAARERFHRLIDPAPPPASSAARMQRRPGLYQKPPDAPGSGAAVPDYRIDDLWRTDEP
jgi:hypothetical protein